MTTRADCLARDAADPLHPLRDLFALPDGVVYLDGNSLGALPKATAARVQQVVQAEWGEGLVRSWNSAGWIGLQQQIGNRIAGLVGAGENELIVADSTSVNLYKALSTAIAFQQADSPRRKVIVSERGNFPTDLYIAETLAAAHGMTLSLIDIDELPSHLNDELAVLMLTQVDYRSGRLLDMAVISRAAHAAGALVVWDLAHSAGALPVNLKGSTSDGPGSDVDPQGLAFRPADAADFAIGCGYKYLNGGPGAPAFVWVHPRHLQRMDREQSRQPLSGWLGHAAPFEFTPGYRPAAGIQRFVAGTPPILSLVALGCGVEVFAQAEALGGIQALRAKSLALSSLFMALVESRCAGHGLSLATPRDEAQRGSQASYAHADAYPLMQALIERGVIGDFRAPDLLRFGFTPLMTRFVDVWDAVEVLRHLLESGAWRAPRFQSRSAVT